MRPNDKGRTNNYLPKVINFCFNKLYMEKMMNKRVFGKLICLSTILIFGSVFHPGTALSEGSTSFGNAAHGVNRVVRTYPLGFAAISGSCAMTMYLPKDRAGNYTALVQRYKDAPSFYLGGKADDAEFDGGMQYEGSRNGSIAGWTAFISKNTIFRNPQVWSANGRTVPWRKGTGNSVSETLRLEFFREPINGNAVVGLKVGGLSSYGPWFYWTGQVKYASARHHLAPYIGDNSWEFRNTSIISVKRVTAMTRDDGNYALDGSWLQSDWRSCTAHRNFADGTSESPRLTPIIVDPTETGYDSPGGDGAQAYDRDGNPLTGAQFIVDFPHLNVSKDEARDPDSQNATFSGVSRYTNEDVNIWLRLSSRKVGRPKGNGN